MRRYWYGLIILAVAALSALLWASAWPSPVSAADAQTMRVANELYAGGQTQEAIRLYEQLVAGGVRNVELYYNLGLARNAVGNVGDAMLYWRRAEVLAPRDADVQAQLAALRAEAGTRPPARDLPQRLDRSLEALVSPDETALIALAGWLLFALLLFATSARRPGFFRSVLRALTILAGVFALVAILAFGARMFVLLLEPPAVVMSEVRPASEPGVASERPALRLGSEVAVLARENGWLQLLLPGSGSTGWVPEDAVALVSPLPFGPLSES